VVSVVAGAGWAWLVLRRLADLLDAERILQGEDHERELELRRTQSQRAVAWGFVAAFAMYALGGWLQARAPIGGLLATLWILAPILALLSARGTARRARTSLADVLSLRRPSAAHLLGALCIAPALAALMRAWVPLQMRLLPMPSSQGGAPHPLGALLEMAPWALFCVLALSPAVNEELLFRGALQGGLSRDMRPGRVAAWQAVLFGLAHASIYRFVPTALLGAMLSLCTWRARSLFPAMLLHAAYNGILVLGETYPALADDRLAWLAPLGLALFILAPPARPARGPGAPAGPPFPG
jgi:sodium transport system permease protein